MTNKPMTNKNTNKQGWEAMAGVPTRRRLLGNHLRQWTLFALVTARATQDVSPPPGNDSSCTSSGTTFPGNHRRQRNGGSILLGSSGDTSRWTMPVRRNTIPPNPTNQAPTSVQGVSDHSATRLCGTMPCLQRTQQPVRGHTCVWYDAPAGLASRTTVAIQTSDSRDFETPTGRLTTATE